MTRPKGRDGYRYQLRPPPSVKPFAWLDQEEDMQVTPILGDNSRSEMSMSGPTI